MCDISIIEKARQAAYMEATKTDLKNALPSMEETLKDIRKPRLRVVQQYMCDTCDSVIQDSAKGFVIWGNIYNASPQNVKGLIGDNFPPELKSIEQVRKTVLCKPCFIKAMGLEEPQPESRRVHRSYGGKR